MQIDKFSYYNARFSKKFNQLVLKYIFCSYVC